mmetsp:Transcript_12240/g.19767  ORF Transcript_12240/g.19767 Transcript_12240/m.19767 type:complete len:224 (-) Transcript_12240:611-1282(-)
MVSLGVDARQHSYSDTCTGRARQRRCNVTCGGGRFYAHWSLPASLHPRISDCSRSNFGLVDGGEQRLSASAGQGSFRSLSQGSLALRDFLLARGRQVRRSCGGGVGRFAGTARRRMRTPPRCEADCLEHGGGGVVHLHGGGGVVEDGAAGGGWAPRRGFAPRLGSPRGRRSEGGCRHHRRCRRHRRRNGNPIHRLRRRSLGRGRVRREVRDGGVVARGAALKP